MVTKKEYNLARKEADGIEMEYNKKSEKCYGIIRQYNKDTTRERRLGMVGLCGISKEGYGVGRKWDTYSKVVGVHDAGLRILSFDESTDRRLEIVCSEYYGEPGRLFSKKITAKKFNTEFEKIIKKLFKTMIKRRRLNEI